MYSRKVVPEGCESETAYISAHAARKLTAYVSDLRLEKWAMTICYIPSAYRAFLIFIPSILAHYAIAWKF